MKTVKFNEWVGVTEFAQYFNGRTAITLKDPLDGEPIATCTMNVDGEPQEPDEVFIKNYSENEGMTDALVEAGIIEPPHRKFTYDWVQVEVCKLKKVENLY